MRLFFNLLKVSYEKTKFKGVVVCKTKVGYLRSGGVGIEIGLAKTLGMVRASLWWQQVFNSC